MSVDVSGPPQQHLVVQHANLQAQPTVHEEHRMMSTTCNFVLAMILRNDLPLHILAGIGNVRLDLREAWE
ncbi:hypothetical protein CFIMG_007388RA00001 [Ceratocystis fimbriata CBS 114723]|uniref:Uncharacterized protein n=1 Tax=Ceratocystis fimbriata CBS 114723 TaxID=1035309 RepID=A0A2C5WXS0_9PEZI|nr:hypothetical protein CFIMG_007388RA00001 [Ceratocystis fimbriata CBS 114723]